ncbi:deuterosome assembly protein 1-like [Bufo gargarizans]|uniref:deuterosome assembly protein 1-like n=1 Tax=Bufo gargarizans TaxID=30331 RepID=UPI001CF448DC|nr:deuterosome assembly protein 1-like [Bufo gargarizans]
MASSCSIPAKRSQSHQEQLSGRTRLQDEAITNNQSEIRRLRCQLHASQETIISGRVIVENLKSTVKEITLSRNLLKDENQRLLQQLRDCQKRCQRMENKLLTIELQAQEDLSRAAEMDQRDLHTFILQYSEEKKLSAQDSDVFMKERTPNREKVQKRLKLSPCKHDQVTYLERPLKRRTNHHSPRAPATFPRSVNSLIRRAAKKAKRKTDRRSLVSRSEEHIEDLS